MTDWTPGVKADATKVCDLLTDRYTNPTKNSIRKWVVAELKAAEPTLVLDLWGGGKSAVEMTAAGLPVLSVDDGRSFAEFGITKPRGKRALTVKGELDGYRTGWGLVSRFAPECDAAWLDFMGHPCREKERALAACRGQKIIVVTLFAARLADHKDLSVESYVAMYPGFIEHWSGLRVRVARKYKSAGGQWALVFLARATRREEKAAYKAAYYATHREETVARSRAYNSAHREEIRATKAAYRATHLEETNARRARKKAERLNTGGDA